MSLINKLNDYSWDLLDTLHLGEFFDSHGLPPLLFPILIIGVILLVVFLLLVPLGGPADACGDGVCSDSEQSVRFSCPEDCTYDEEPPEPETKTIRVYVSGGVTCASLNIILKDGNGNTISSKLNQQTRAVQFQDVSADRVSVEVSTGQSTQASIRAGPISTEEEDTLRVTLPDDYCAPTERYGSIRAVVKDASTDELIGANVAVFDTGDTRKASRFVSGEDTFQNLEAGEWYYLTATAPGYNDYYDDSNTVLVEADRETLTTIRMTPSAAPPDATGQLEVCVIDEDDVGIEHSGEIGIYSVDGDLMTTGRLSQCSLFRGQASGEGCYIFTLTAGIQVFAGLTRAPSSCSDVEQEGPIVIPENDKEFVTLHLNCNLIGGIRAIVYGNDSEVVTDQCTVELYHENDTKIKTMDMAADGNYTETVALQDGLEVYVYAKNVPDGYLETKSGDVDIEAEENQTVTITLATPPPPLPNLTMGDISISRQILHRSENITVTLNSVRLLGNVITPAEGASVSCESSWGQTVSATYKGFWECNLTTPDTVGEKTIALRATKQDTNPAIKSASVFVVNDTVETLYITEVSRSPLTPVALTFNISYYNGTHTLPVAAVQDGYIEVVFKPSNGPVANITSITGGDGTFSTRFFVPFKGVYQYEMWVRSVLDNKLHTGYISGEFTSTQGATNAISCSVEPQLTGPNGETEVISTFAPINGMQLPNQRIQATVIGRQESRTWPLAWNPQAEEYTQTVTALSAECKHVVNCSSVDDPTIWRTTSLYVADSDALNVDPVDCPLQNPALCQNSVAKARNCYKYLLDNPTLLEPLVQNIITCASYGLPSCGQSEPPSTDCYQAMGLRVRAMGEITEEVWDNDTNTTVNRTYTVSNVSDMLYFRLLGSYEGQASSLSYPRPGLSGVSSSDREYSLLEIHLPGGQSEPLADASGPRTQFATPSASVWVNDSTGALAAIAYCPLDCGGLGDLNGDGDVTDQDISIMTTVIDTIALMGAPPYDPWPSPCLDLNGDTLITREDLDCMLSPGTCVDCNPDASLEICHDGYDNDCDGQMDMESYDNEAGEFYSFNGVILEDLCSCTPKTPCDMLYDIDGIIGVSDEGDAMRCSSISQGAYTWKPETGWECTSSRNGQTLQCDGKSFVCTQSGGNWVWLRQGGVGMYPPNPL